MLFVYTAAVVVSVCVPLMVSSCLVLQDYSPDLHTISRKQTTKSSANDGGVTITKIQRNSSHHDNFTPRNDTTTSSQPPPR